MHVAKSLVALFAASSATAKFFTPREIQQHVQLRSNSGLDSRAAANNNNDDHGGRSDNPVFKRGQYTIRPQNDTTCKSLGEKHWAGTIDITGERRLFYWFFDSRSDPENDPIIIWLNGGPGASSMNGFFQEMGPCYIPANSTTTKPNPHSWNNKASVLFIDQPAGVGFSQLKPGAPVVNGDFAGGRDLQTFLNMFFKNVFPSRAKLPIHFAGESYGGHYVPAAMKEILEARERDSVEAFWGNITSVVLVSPVMEYYAIDRGFYDLFCTEYRTHHSILWNQTVCDRLANALVKWDRITNKCDYTLRNDDCKKIDDDSDWLYDVLYEDETLDTHNLNAHCYNQPYCDPPQFGSMGEYLNQPHILEALGFASTYEWYLSDNRKVAAYYNTTYYVPMTDVFSNILDATTAYPKHQKDPIRVLILGGNLDTVANTPGQQWFLEKLPWSGAAWWRSQVWKEATELNLGGDSGGLWKASKTRQLMFVAFDHAGHMVPMDLPELSDKVIKKWMDATL